MSQSCLDCPQRADRAFCDLEPDALQEFDEIKSLESKPYGTVLFREGQTARSVFVLCEGRVRLTVRSECGSRMSLRVASPGEVLGLSAALAGGSHQVTAEVMEPVQVAEVRRSDLLRFLREHTDICMQVVHLLSEDLHEAYGRVRAVGLSRTRHSHSA
jgi:CRP/FNR family transcriptional regulator, cyclic AMP receptor protein